VTSAVLVATVISSFFRLRGPRIKLDNLCLHELLTMMNVEDSVDCTSNFVIDGYCRKNYTAGLIDFTQLLRLCYTYILAPWTRSPTMTSLYYSLDVA
jgi:hypothetical protein